MTRFNIISESSLAPGGNLAADLYCWLFDRLRHVERETRPIAWSVLARQFGFVVDAESPEGLKAFRGRVEAALGSVAAALPGADVSARPDGLVLRPLKI